MSVRDEKIEPPQTLGSLEEQHQRYDALGRPSNRWQDLTREEMRRVSESVRPIDHKGQTPEFIDAFHESAATISEDGKSLLTVKDIVEDWIARNPQRNGEPEARWKERGRLQTHHQIAALRKMQRYERRVWWTMLARGIIAAYILGIVTSFGIVDPRAWSAFASICAGTFAIGWIVAMGME